MIDELENIPEDKLQLLLELIRSSKSDLSDLQPKRKSITDYAGSWKEIDSDQYNTMIDELENIPEDKLQLLLELIRSSKSDLSDLQPKRKSITDYAGSWKEIDSDQYITMIKELRDRREKARRERNV